MSDPRWGNEAPRSGSEFVRELWRVGRDAAAMKKQVAQAVAEAGRGKTREQLRVLFADESARHGVPRDPVWVERALDELEWSPVERAQQAVGGLLVAGRELGRMARSHGIPDAPAWMQPPPSASSRRGELVEVLRPRCRAWCSEQVCLDRHIASLAY